MANESTFGTDAAPRRILVVDDDALMRIFYRRLFEIHEDEFDCCLVPSAETALEHLRWSEVDAAILDWDLPGISGLQLLKALRANAGTRTLPIILASGRSSPDCEALALKSGADAYLAKPFAIDRLLAHLRNFARRREG